MFRDAFLTKKETPNMILDLPTLTLLHVVLSLLGIASGVVVMYGLIAAKRLETWTALFLLTTVATSVTGFFFPFVRFLPSHGVGIVSLLVLTAAIVARYAARLAGAWRPIYAVSAVIALYLNLFVLVVQMFQKVPALAALAPTQSEPPFLLTQSVLLTICVVFTIAATMRFRSEPDRAV